ncbi:preprotein translocase subunit SecY [Nesterenkonia alba]|uniref:preprotein translocase subunit SecY n=1 Tax=Nesterenkonia alba TaxID=515814 RepID=UPI0003B37B57|nr:preprotein translocase subunit SecY [Nesterenkonia alba]
MFSAIARVFASPDLRMKILFTLGIITIYRIGAFIPAPGVDYNGVQQCLELGNTEGGLYAFVNMFSGGAMLQVSIFALGVMPYITAAIITQLLRVVIPRFEALQREGAQGQAKLTQYTRYLTLGIGTLNATTLVTMANTGALLGCEPGMIIPDGNILILLLMILSMVTGVAMIMWLGEQITERGVGNGMSILIFVAIAAGFPGSMRDIFTVQGWQVFTVVCIIGLILITAIVFVEQSQRRVPVQYAKKQVGRRTVGGTSTYIPIKVNMAGVIPVIFSSSVLMLPSVWMQFNQPAAGEEPGPVTQFVSQYFGQGDHPVYMAVFFLMTMGFTYFYVTITFNPNEVAENMRKYGGFIPGIRAGKPTESYLGYVISRITFPGALYLGFIALIPLIAFVLIGADQNFPFGGTSILIMVGVGLTTVKQISAQLEQHNYEGLLR